MSARDQPRNPLPSTCPHCQGEPVTPASLIAQWLALGERVWQIALLTVIDEGPARPGEATQAAIAWVDGNLPPDDLPAELDVMLTDGLLVRLGPPGSATPLAITSAGRALLAAADHAAAHRDLLDTACVEARTFRDRVAALSPGDRTLAGLVGLGWPDQRIATALGITRRAVEHRVHRLVRRLGMTSRNALIARITIDAIETAETRLRPG